MGRIIIFRLSGPLGRQRGPLWRRLLVWTGAYAAALFLAAQVVRGIEVEGWQALLGATLLFGMVNTLVRPVVSLITCPLQLLTLGLFTLVINAAMLGLTAWAAGQLDIAFSVDGLAAAFLGALLVTMVGSALSRWGGRLLYTTL